MLNAMLHAQPIPIYTIPALFTLRGMLHKFWASELGGKRLPLAFWTIEDNDLFFDALQYLPVCVLSSGGRSGHGHTDDELQSLPIGFQHAVALFDLEDGFANEGYTAIPNLGEARVQEIANIYRHIGMASRAAVLERVLAACMRDPSDEDAMSEAADGGLPDLIDTEHEANQVMAYFRAESQAWSLPPELDQSEWQ
ncbi:hypothetical protein SAMD00023378_0644 [Ralstonia sp. NT80]|nr:hypothetical protein SAMD00023378_0644 [Ralstonia sp. NT80]